MKMFTIDGQAVEVVKKIEEGYLAKMVYETYSEDSEDYEEVSADQVLYFETLFDKPVTEKIAEEIKKLKADEQSLVRAIEDLRGTKRSEEGLLNKINKYPFFKMLADYLTGEFNFYLDLSDYEIKHKDKLYHSPFVSLRHSKSGGFQLRKLNNDEYHSDYDRRFIVFNTRDEAIEFSKKHFLNHIARYESTYNPASNLKEWFSKIHDTNDAKKDAEVVLAYTKKHSELLIIQTEKVAAQINKEIEEKKKQLDRLTQPV